MTADLIRGNAACYSSGTPGRAIVQMTSHHLVTDDPSEPASYYQGPGQAPVAVATPSTTVEYRIES